MSNDDLTREEHPHRIHEMLESFVVTSAILTATEKEGAYSFSSRVIRIGLRHLDISVPAAMKAELEALVMVGEEIEITVHLQDDAGVYFRCKIMGKSHDRDGTESLRLFQPNCLMFDQRRRNRRLTSMSPPPAVILEGRTKKLSGLLENLSVTGMSMRIPMDGLAVVRSGETYTRCSIALNTGTVNCSASIIHSQERGRDLHIGASLSGLSPHDRRSIERYMAAAERELIRKFREMAGDRGLHSE